MQWADAMRFFHAPTENVKRPLRLHLEEVHGFSGSPSSNWHCVFHTCLSVAMKSFSDKDADSNRLQS